MCDKQIGLSFDNVSLNAKGYEIDELIKLINVVTNKVVTKATNIKSEVEEINLKSLRDNIRYPKTTSNFKCPHCGQSILLYAEYNKEKVLFVRDITKEKPSIYDADVLQLPKLYDVESGKIDKEVLVNVYKDLLSMLNEEKLLVDTDESIGVCPVCEYEDRMANWIEAYENPMKYFDNMQMCDVCGEEGNIIVTQDGDCLSCENKCIVKINA